MLTFCLRLIYICFFRGEWQNKWMTKLVNDNSADLVILNVCLCEWQSWLVTKIVNWLFPILCSRLICHSLFLVRPLLFIADQSINFCIRLIFNSHLLRANDKIEWIDLLIICIRFFRTNDKKVSDKISKWQFR